MASEKWLDAVREDFPALEKLRNGKPPIYFDNACTTLVPKQVIEAINQYYTDFPACGGGRSRNWFANEIALRIEGDQEDGTLGSRQVIRNFINAESEREIVFTMNTSHAINLVALGFNFRPGDTVLLSDKEHNSNLLPWLRLQRTGRIKVDYVATAPDGQLDLEDLKRKLRRRRVRMVSMAYTSNLTGATLPAKEVSELAHRYGARLFLDAAQAAPHRLINVREIDADLLAFSLHKMCGPRGVGVLYGKRELLGDELAGNGDFIEPILLGGGTVDDTTYDNYSLTKPPERFEVGIQNYAGQIAAADAIAYLQEVGFQRIQTHEGRLNTFLTEQLLGDYGDSGWFRILGPQDAKQRSGILTFEVRRPNAVGITEDLHDKSNVMTRDGVFCAHAYLNKEYGEGWTHPRLPKEHRMVYRVSLYFYNTLEECRVFLDTLHDIFKERSYI